MIPDRGDKGTGRVWYNLGMKPLIETNPYLRDPEERRRLLEENAYTSSVVEGARGLPRPHTLGRSRRARASKKNPAKAS